MNPFFNAGNDHLTLSIGDGVKWSFFGKLIDDGSDGRKEMGL